MVVLAGHSSPSSLQLRWGLNHRKPPPASLQIRFPAPDGRRRRLARLVAAGSTRGEDGDGVVSRAEAGESKDRFSGWSGEDSDGGTPRKGKFEGFVGVGLAGILFTAGIAFAALSYGRKNVGRPREMEPLTVEQEVLLESDEHNESTDSIEIESNSTVPEESSTFARDSETGTSKENISPLDTIDFDADSRAVSSPSEDDQSAAIDAKDIKKGSTREDHNRTTNLDDPLGLTVSDLNSITKPAHTDQPSADDFSIKDQNSSLASGLSGSSVRLTDRMEASTLAGISSATDSEKNDGDRQEGGIFSGELENSKDLLYSGASRGGTLGDTSSLENSVEISANIDPQFASDGVVKVVGRESEEQESQPLPNEGSARLSLDHSTNVNASSVTNSQSDLNPYETLQVPYNSASSPLEEHKLDTDERFEALAPTPVAPLDSQSKPSDHFETHKVRPAYESTLPQKSFSSAGIPAPSIVSAASQVPPGKVLVPATVDQVQGQALAALQVLKVIEADIEPGAICSRREYARWLVSASSILSRNTASKVYPAMYIENVTELAFDDVTPQDPDFPFIQGLAEAGLISSKLSRSDLDLPASGDQDSSLFSPESPVSRQDLVSWKMALERRQLPDVDRKILHQCSGYIDIDRINPDAWPAIVADLSSREHGIIPLAFGYTRLFQPDKPVTKAQAAIALTTGEASEMVAEELTRIEAESMADAAVAAHTALVAQVEQDLNASFEKELAVEKQKVDAVEKLAQEAKLELEKLRREREEENGTLIRGRAAVESEMEVLSKLRNEVEEQLQSLMGNKMEMAFEREKILKLRKEAEKENDAIVQLQYELEVERKALSMARAWAEEEAKRAIEQAKALEEARERWERHGLKVVVEGSLRDDELAGTTWLNAGNQSPLQETINRGEGVLEKLRAMAAGISGNSAVAMERMIQIISSAVSALKQFLSKLPGAVAATACKSVEDLRGAASELSSVAAERSSRSIQELRESASGFYSGVRDGAKRAVEDCREGVEKITQKFKT